MALITGNPTFWSSFEAPNDGQLRDASNFLVPIGGLADRTVYLRGLLESASGAVVLGNTQINGTLNVALGATFSGAASFASTTTFFNRTRVAAPTYLADADVTLDATTLTNRVIMPTITTNRIITLRQSTSPVPVNGDWFEITVFLPDGVSPGITLSIRREGSGSNVVVLGPGANNTNEVASARVQLVSGVWRLTAVGGKHVFRGTQA